MWQQFQALWGESIPFRAAVILFGAGLFLYFIR